MSMTADSSSNHHSAGEGSKSTQFRIHSPWNKIVRGESESVSASNQFPPASPNQLPYISPSPVQSLSSPEPNSLSGPSVTDEALKTVTTASDGPMAGDSYETDKNNAVGGTKKPVWNKPSNGGLEGAPVMGAVTWPALSLATQASSKTTPELSLKCASEGSVSHPQENSTLNPSQRQCSSSTGNLNAGNHNSGQHSSIPARPRPGKRGGGAGGNNSGGHVQSGITQTPPPPPPPLPSYPMFPLNMMTPNSYPPFVPSISDTTSREPLYGGNNWEVRPVGGFVPPPPFPLNDQRRRYSNTPRGEGPQRNSYGGRRDQDRANYSNTRDGHMHPQRAPPRGFVRAPLPNASLSFVHTPPMRGPFIRNPMGFAPPEMLYVPQLPMEPYGGRPYIAHVPPPPMMMPVSPVPELAVSDSLLVQIDYYFSEENLAKDGYLLSNMDEQGWVSVSVIAEFRRVKQMNIDIQQILDALKSSSVVEVQDTKLRRRGWLKPKSTSDTITNSLKNLTIEEKKTGAVSQPKELFSSEQINKSVLCNGESSGDSHSHPN